MYIFQDFSAISYSPDENNAGQSQGAYDTFPPVKTFTLDQFKKWGAEGALKRRPRKLTRAQSLRMIEAREAKKKAGK